jgi:hypothetical protein
LIANPTAALRDFLYEALHKEPDIELASEVCDQGTILSASEHARADIVVLPLEDAAKLMPICRELLASAPGRKVLAMGAGTDLMALWWWSEGDVRCTYMEASLENLLEVCHSPVS